jgi:hypothetical protein
MRGHFNIFDKNWFNLKSFNLTTKSMVLTKSKKIYVN